MFDQNFLGSVFRFLPAMTSALTVSAVAGMTVYYIIGGDVATLPIDRNIMTQVARNQLELSSVRERLATISNRIETIANVSDEASSDLEIKRLEIAVKELREETKIIETIRRAVVENPERAMSVPMLRRDVDALSIQLAEDISVTQREIDRIYDLTKWFLALMATMAVGVLGLALSNLRKGQ